MICECGSERIQWDASLTETRCPDCGCRNCHKYEPDENEVEAMTPTTPEPALLPCPPIRVHVGAMRRTPDMSPNSRFVWFYTDERGETSMRSLYDLETCIHDARHNTEQMNRGGFPIVENVDVFEVLP